MASIGSVTVAFIQGRVAALGSRLEDISRPGVNGHAFKKIGNRAPVSQLITLTDVASAAAATTHQNNCNALRGGDPITVTYNDGQTITNVQVLDVEPVRVTQVATPVGGLAGGAWLVTMRWQCQQVA